MQLKTKLAMKQYIDKTDLVDKIGKRIKELQDLSKEGKKKLDSFQKTAILLCIDECKVVLNILDTLEMKKVEEKFECPNIKIKDAIEVSSRMEYIDEDLKPIADFIMDYASWNLHRDEWNQPVLEVPLFRVLDALAQRGKPYCCAG